MAVKIRLQRHGKKGKPFYWIVAADARSKRDGKYLEKIGTYDPNTSPATIDLNFDSAISWLDKGAQPTNTAKAILSYSGVLLKRHLDGGVKKGAFTEAEAKKRFDNWMKEKSAKIQKKIEDVNAALESNKKEASNFAVSVFPTPEGPRKIKDPEGLFGSFNPDLVLLIALLTA